MKKLFTALLTAASAVSASAATIKFDDAWTALGQGSHPTTYYASSGLTVGGSYFGLVGGNGNGDPGNWNLEGTNGSAFLGSNQAGQAPVFNFATLVDGVSIDVGLVGFDMVGTITVTAYLNGNAVETHSVAATSAGDPGVWTTFSFAAALDSLKVNFAGGSTTRPGLSGYGVDNLSFSAADVPEPAMLGLFGLGAIGLGLSRRRKA